jgi:hypothetical protein
VEYLVIKSKTFGSWAAEGDNQSDGKAWDFLAYCHNQIVANTLRQPKDFTKKRSGRLIIIQQVEKDEPLGFPVWLFSA